MKSPDYVYQRKQNYPQQIDKMPINRSRLHSSMVVKSIAAFFRFLSNVEQNDETQKHVHKVKYGQNNVKHKKSICA